jgi:hypothetical protein
LLIGFLPTISNKQKRLKEIAKYLGILFLVANLFYALKFLYEIIFYGMDGGIYAIFYLLIFYVADVYLATLILKL